MAQKKRKGSVSIVKVDEEDKSLIRGIFLDEEADSLIRQLFSHIDKNNDGTLSQHDFDVFDSWTGPTEAEKWKQLRAMFDHNADGNISLAEFRDGFKKLALTRPAMVGSLPPPSTNLGTWLDEIEVRVNQATHELCHEIHRWLSAQ